MRESPPHPASPPPGAERKISASEALRATTKEASYGRHRFRLEPPVRTGSAGAGAALDRLSEIQLYRRPQRSRACAGERNWLRLPRRCCARDGADLALYNPHGPQGFRGIREFVVDKVEARGIACTADDVLITSGSGQGLDLVNRVTARIAATR